jgi:hypothetical protein
MMLRTVIASAATTADPRYFVLAGLDPAIHANLRQRATLSWMPGPSPGKTGG